MKNPFKKILKNEIRLISEWPPQLTADEKRELEVKLADAEKRLKELLAYQKGGVGNDYRSREDEALMDNLNMEIKRMREELGLDGEQRSFGFNGEISETVIRGDEDPEVKARIDEFTKKIRDSAK